MKKTIFLLPFLLFIFFYNFSFSQTFDWESATDLGATVTETKGAPAITATVSTSFNDAQLVNGSGFDGSSGNIVFTSNANDSSSLTITFSTAVNVLSIFTFIGDGDAVAGTTMDFTPTGGSNSVVTEFITQGAGEVVTLNWTGVTEIIITVNGGGNETFAIDDILLGTANTAPAFTSSPVTSVDEGDTYTYNITTNDADSDAVTITAPTLPSWLNLNTNSTVSTFAGSGSAGSTNATGTSASFNFPYGIETDASGNIYIGDTSNNLIRKITPAGVVTTLAGSGSAGSANGTGTAASFSNPRGMAIDAAGNLYVADTFNNMIRKITPAGVVTTFAGSGAVGSANGTGIAASFNRPGDVAIDASGNLYVGDSNNRIRKITPAGVVTTFAGSGSAGSANGTGIAASFFQPFGLTVDASGNVYVADHLNHLIRKITPAGVVTTLAGSGSVGSANGTGAAASFNLPVGISLDAANNVYVADQSNHLIRKITPTGVVTTFAGTGANGSANGSDTASSFSFPTGVTFGASGRLYVMDRANHLVREIVTAYELTGDSTGEAGMHPVVLEANDGNGGTVQQSFTVTVNDITAPTGYSVLIDQDPINSVNDDSVSFTFAGAEIGATYNYTFSSSGGAGTVTGSGTITTATDQITGIDVNGIPDGTITLSVTLTDPSSNIGNPVTDTSTKETVAPIGYSVSIDQDPINAGNDDSVSFTFAGAEVGATYNYTFSSSGGAGTVTGSGTITTANDQISSIDLSGIPDGTITLSVTLTDVNGNTGSAVTDTVTKDTQAPIGYSVTIDQDPINSVNDNSVSFTFASAEVGATYNYTFSSSGGAGTVTGSGTVASAGATISSIDVSGIPDGTITLSVTLTDVNGNTGSAVTDTATKETVAPTGYSISIDQDPINAGNDDSVSFTFADAEVGATYNYTFSSSGGAGTVTGSGTVASAGATISGIDLSGISDGTITLSVTLTDVNGNTGSAVTDTSTKDTMAPIGYTVTIDQDPINSVNDDSVSFTFAGAEVGATYNYTFSSSGGAGIVTGSGTITTATDQITGVDVSGISDGTITLSVTLTDINGNTGSAVTDTATKETVAPTGYSVTIDQDPIDSANENAVSFTFAGAEVGATYNYTFSSSGGAGIVTGSGTITTATDQITGIDVSSVPDGTVTLSVTLTDVNGNIGSAVTDTATKNTDADITVNDPSITEGDSGTVILQYTVSLSNTKTSTITVDVATSDGTASSGSDYTALGTTTLTFLAGEMTQTVDVTINGDTTLEADETINLNLSSATGPSVIADATGVGTITNDDAASVTIADISGNEDDGNITVTATLDNGVQGGFSVDVSTADGTATIADSDYTAVTGETLTFTGNAGETQTFTVTPIADTRFEDTETLTVSQSNLTGTGLSVTITDGATVTVTNDDTAPTVTLSVNNSSIDEVAGTATLTATLSAISGKDVTVDLGYSGTASNGTDYNSSASTSITINAGDISANAAVIISTIDDPNPETDETIIVDIIGVTDGTENGTQQQTITINDNDIPNVEFIATSSNGLESVSSADLIVHTNIVSALTVTVDYTVTGTATGGGVDHTLADGTVTWTPGLMYQLISISGIVDDTILEANETVIITLSNPSNAVLGTNTEHTYTITNNDNATVTISDISSNEDDGDITVTATLDNGVQGGFSVDVSTADGTATTADSDYTAVTGETLIFTGNAGETQTFTITPTVDTKVEADETLTVSQSNLSTALVVDITDGATVTITNDDTATISLADVSVNEDDGTINAIATLDNAVDGGFTLNASTVEGTALEADDFTAFTDQAISFAGNAGETQNIALTIIDDAIGEGTEELTIVQSSIIGTTLVGDIIIDDSAIVTILDDDAPIITSVSVPADDSYGIGDNLDFTVTFTSAITIIGSPTIPLTIGSSLVDATLNGTVMGSTTATFRYTVVEGDLDTDGIEVGSAIDLNGGSIADAFDIDAILTLNSVGDTSNVNVDGIRPTVTLNTIASSPTNAPFVVIISLSEQAMGLDLTDISVTNGITGVFNLINPTTYSVMITPITDGEVTVRILAAAFQDLSGNDNVASNVITLTYDITRPTITITSDAVDPTNGSFIATFTADEDLANFEETDIILTNATISDFVSVSDALYTATITPLVDGLVSLDIFENTVNDDASNGNLPATYSITYDATRPTVAITSMAADPINVPFIATFTFSEDVSGFDIGDITLGNATASDFMSTTASEYTALITPTVDGTVTIDIAENVAEDAATNGNEAATQFTIEYDGTNPTVTITSMAADPTNVPFTATVTFSEDVTGFDMGDIMLGNATASDFMSISASVYTALITPTVDGTVTIDIAADVAEDAATNGNEAATQFTIEYDATNPTVVITTDASDPTNAAFTATITFSEDVTGFELGDITLGNATASDFMMTTASVYTALITPTIDGMVTIDIAANVAEDAATNPNDAAMQFTIEYDATNPTVVITTDAVDPTNIAFTATITFSEDVTGFEIGDITLGNATASDFTMTSASVYTALVTPTADGMVTVDIAAGIAIDAATNPNDAASTYSVLYDATNPTVSITTTASDPVNVPFVIDIVFSEDVTGFDITDLAVTNGTPSDFMATSASVYSALITPTASDDVIIDIAMGAAQDAATNPNDAAQLIIVYDNIPPVAPSITHISDYTCTGDVTMTGDNTLEISGIAEENSEIEIFENGASVGITTTSDTGFFTFDHTGTTLADGIYNFTVTATDIAGNTSDVSTPLNITINSVDTDGDGLPDFCDDDDDGNGVADADEDCDGDGIIDSQDTDNSSCTSTIEQTKSYGFSPNGDGVNDGWFIENITSFPNSVVQVFNRSGKLVFKKKGYQNDWEAISNQTSSSGTNSRLPVGPYLFIIDLGDGSQPSRGWIYINY